LFDRGWCAGPVSLNYRPLLLQQGVPAWAAGAKAVMLTVVTNISARLRAMIRVIDMVFLHLLNGHSYVPPPLINSST
jgi:hypothetical protein